MYRSSRSNTSSPSRSRWLPDLYDLRTFNSAERNRCPQCVLKSVTVHPQKLGLEIFELEEFLPGSKNRKKWLRIAFLRLIWGSYYRVSKGHRGPAARRCRLGGGSAALKREGQNGFAELLGSKEAKPINGS